MKTRYISITVMILAASALLGGCATRRPEGPAFNTVSSDDLVVTVRADKRIAEVGDTVALTITAKNPRRRDLRIESDTPEPIIVTVWRYDALGGWKRAMVFPPASLRQYTAWDLGGHDTRTFTVSLPIEQGWPLLETLKISAELSGRPDVRPHIFLTVMPKGADGDE